VGLPAHPSHDFILIAEVDDDHFLVLNIWRLLAVNTGYELDLVAQGFADNPGGTEAVSTVSVVDAHRFAFRHIVSSPARQMAGI